MFYNALFILPGFLSMAVGFTVPDNTADGFYSATYDANGTEVHTLIKPAVSLRQVAPELAELSSAGMITARDGPLSKRTPDSLCDCNAKLSSSDTDAAVAGLKTQVGQGVYIAPGMSYYQTSGGVVAFVCNLDGDSVLKVWTDIITQSAGQITQACGLYVTGSVGGQFTYAAGYMAKDQSFCDSQTSLTEDHC